MWMTCIRWTKNSIQIFTFEGASKITFGVGPKVKMQTYKPWKSNMPPLFNRLFSEFHYYFGRGKNHHPKGTTISLMVATTSRVKDFLNFSGGGFKEFCCFLAFLPTWSILTIFCQMGWNHQPAYFGRFKSISNVLNDYMVHCLVFSDWHILQIRPTTKQSVQPARRFRVFTPWKINMEPEKSREKGNHLNQTFKVIQPSLCRSVVQALDVSPVFPFALPQVATVDATSGESLTLPWTFTWPGRAK